MAVLKSRASPLLNHNLNEETIVCLSVVNLWCFLHSDATQVCRHSNLSKIKCWCPDLSETTGNVGLGQLKCNSAQMGINSLEASKKTNFKRPITFVILWRTRSKLVFSKRRKESKGEHLLDTCSKPWPIWRGGTASINASTHPEEKCFCSYWPSLHIWLFDFWVETGVSLQPRVKPRPSQGQWSGRKH